MNDAVNIQGMYSIYSANRCIKFSIFATIMGYAKERKKLEKLSEKTIELQHFDSANLAIITDIFEQYSHTIRILKNKDTETFNSLYLNELQAVKTAKTALKLSEEVDRQIHFMAYKEVLLDAITKTIKATIDVA